MTQKQTTPDSHTYVSASNTNIWCPYEGDGCTGMPLLQKQLVEDGILDFSRRDETETEYQRVGTLIHNIGAGYILALFSGEKKLEDLAQASDEEYMAFGYAKWIWDTYKNCDGHWIERKFFVREDVGGTGDFICVKDKTLAVCDLKTGVNPVWSENNPQLLFYAACVIEEHPEVEEVVLNIYQPNGDYFPVDSWRTNSDTVLEYKKKVLLVLDKIDSGDVKFMSGNCHWCKAKPFCPALANNFTDILRIIK